MLRLVEPDHPGEAFCSDTSEQRVDLYPGSGVVPTAVSAISSGALLNERMSAMVGPNTEPKLSVARK